MDTANYEPENTDDPEWRAIYEKRCKEAGFSAYFDYSWQWAYKKKFEEAGLTALLGCGFDPGVTQAYCAYAKKHEFDTIDTIDILDCNGGDHGYAFATNFNLDDKAIFRDHEPLIAPAPACTDSDHFYYKEKKLSFTKQEDVYKRSLQAAKKGKTLTFHWRGGYLTKEVLRELLDLIEKAGKERQKTALPANDFYKVQQLEVQIYAWHWL